MKVRHSIVSASLPEDGSLNSLMHVYSALILYTYKYVWYPLHTESMVSLNQPLCVCVSPTAVSVTFAQDQNTVNEGDAGEICVNVTGELERQVSVSVSYVNGSALGGSCV